MNTTEDIPETIVFDAEPLIAYLCDESGSDTVETYIDAVMGPSNGYISEVNLTEIHYIIRDIENEDRADEAIDVIEETGIKRIDTAETWRLAAEFKHRDSPALGDSFALATAAFTDGLLLVGADDDYDTVSDIRIERFRMEPA